jgi:predicted TIM-barrel fold metal-dependent hydrolase
MEQNPNPKPPIINCHTHIFTGANVPPNIGKTYLIWPLYYLLCIPFVLALFRFWYLHPLSPKRLQYKPFFRNLKRAIYKYRAFVQRYSLIHFFVFIINFIITSHAIIILFLWLNRIMTNANDTSSSLIQQGANWLSSKNLLHIPQFFLLKLFIVLFTLVFIATGRKLILFALQRTWSFFKVMPKKKTLQFLSRYISIGRFAYYKNASRIFTAMKNQYEAKTGFVILPMDMAFMGAGQVREGGNYENQMLQLNKLSKRNSSHQIIYPFVFVDARRTHVGEQVFLNWTTSNGTVTLGNCFIKDYIENKNFSGFKMYPALGYYPFDKNLLALWKYAADNGIPIMTHCIRGTIFYRGRKKKEWDTHPIFKEVKSAGVYQSLLLPQLRNEDFSVNFTHPLNYLCLLEEVLLRKVVEQTNDASIQELFGYSNSVTPLQYNLNHLKICFGHFGGEEEWQKYFESDRDYFTSQLVTKPNEGIEFIKNNSLQLSYGTLERLWKEVDWYSLIRSMMLQKENVYADISYIIHKKSIIPLLKATLQHEKLRQRVLFGTDFYVVRNHNSEKEMLADISDGLNEKDFDAIARYNPVSYLKKNSSSPTK